MALPLILASGSPRRRELLAQAGLRFAVETPRVREERAAPWFSVRELTTCNATRKALAVARLHPDAVVLGADTLVALDDRVIGKPEDEEDALAILRRLRGREHQVCTAVFLESRRLRLRKSFHVFSHVRFHRLTDTALRAYLKKVDPLDKAGAYAAQGDGGEIIAHIRGSYSNVVGLPVDETLQALAAFGVRPEPEHSVA